MSVLFEVRDSVKGYLSVELEAIVACLEPEGSRLVWAILDVEAVGDVTALGMNMLELEERTKSSNDGYTVTWEQLKLFASQLEDVHHLTLAGSDSRLQILTPKLDNSELFSKCRLVVECFDSSFWQVFSTWDSILARFEKQFTNVQVVDG